MSEHPQPGDIWDYPYLWARQAQSGETEGRKPRPVAVAVLLERADGRTGIMMLAITSQAPGPDRRALEIPQTERRRAGLDLERRLWVILDEHNRDIVETSFYLEPQGWIGALSARFRKQVQAAFVTALRERGSAPVRRDRADG